MLVTIIIVLVSATVGALLAYWTNHSLWPKWENRKWELQRKQLNEMIAIGVPQEEVLRLATPIMARIVPHDIPEYRTLAEEFCHKKTLWMVVAAAFGIIGIYAAITVGLRPVRPPNLLLGLAVIATMYSGWQAVETSDKHSKYSKRLHELQQAEIRTTELKKSREEHEQWKAIAARPKEKPLLSKAEEHSRWSEVKRLSDEERTHHIWMPGVSGQGKSMFMLRLAINDICQGLDFKPETPSEDLAELRHACRDPKRGVTIIDPAGDLVSKIIHWIPPERAADTIYIDLKNPVPIDFLGWSNPEEKETIVADILALFNTFSERTGSHVGKVMESVLIPLLYTLLDAKDVSFLDIHDFLQHDLRREEILSQPSISPELKLRWRRMKLSPQDTLPIIRTLTPLIWNPSLRTIFGSRNPALKISDVFFKKKILLVNLKGSQKENRTIVSALIIAKLLQAALSQADNEDESTRTFHMLYVDEFPECQVSSDFKTILSQARKYKLCLTLANQWFDQINDDIFQGLLGVGNMFLFRLQSNDANRFAHSGLRSWQKDKVDALKERGVSRAGIPSDMFMSEQDVLKDFDVLELTRLEKFHAIHRKPTEPIRRVLTGTWQELGESPISHADFIKKRTLELYGCKSVQNPDNSGNAKPEPQPTTSPTPHDAGSASGSSEPFRPPEQGPGSANPKKGAEPKRHQNDKPEPEAT
jgi:hypothetical protein